MDDSLPPLVLVIWRDAYFDFDRGGVDDLEPRDDYLVRTVGHLISRGEKFTTIAQEALPDGDGYRAVSHIPNEIIQTTILLEGVKKEDNGHRA